MLMNGVVLSHLGVGAGHNLSSKYILYRQCHEFRQRSDCPDKSYCPWSNVCNKHRFMNRTVFKSGKLD